MKCKLLLFFLLLFNVKADLASSDVHLDWEKTWTGPPGNWTHDSDARFQFYPPSYVSTQRRLGLDRPRTEPWTWMPASSATHQFPQLTQPIIFFYYLLYFVLVSYYRWFKGKHISQIKSNSNSIKFKCPCMRGVSGALKSGGNAKHSWNKVLYHQTNTDQQKLFSWTYL